jgi:hypothetical protein
MMNNGRNKWDNCTQTIKGSDVGYYSLSASFITMELVSKGSELS